MAEPSVWGFMQESLTWEGSKELVSSLIGALAGAYVGAMTARRVAADEKERDSLLAEVRASNAANSFAFSICNSALTLKKQHILKLKQQFDASHAAILAFAAARQAGAVPQNQIFHFTADLNALPTVALPADALRAVAVDKLTLGGRPMACINALIQSCASLDEILKRRNMLIERTREDRRAGKEPISPAKYFGFADADGHVDRDYADTIAGLSKIVDDVIYFSWLLGQDLVKHGEATSLLLRQRYRTKNIPVVRKADFSMAKADGLMPNEDDYKDWMNGFQPLPKKDVWQRLLGALPPLIRSRFVRVATD